MIRAFKKLIRILIWILLIAALIIAAGVFFPTKKVPDVGFTDNVLIQNVNIVNVTSGQIDYRQNILIRDGRIERISRDNLRPPGELVIIVEGADKYVTPGLWDMHTKSISRAENFQHPLFIANGITHIRDLSGCLNKKDNYWACSKQRKQWNELTKRGELIAPLYHQHTTFPINDGQEIPKNFPDYLNANTPEKANAVINFAREQKADFITVHPALERKTYFAIALQAAKDGLSLAGNKPNSVSLEEAIAAYQKSIDQAWLFAAECSPAANSLRAQANNILSSSIQKRLLQNQDPIKCNGLMRALAESETWWTPTLMQLKNLLGQHSAADAKKYNPLLTRYGLNLLEKRERSKILDPSASNTHRDFYNLSKKQLGQANRLGVRLLAGSSSTGQQLSSGFSLHAELDEMVDAGLTPIQALRAATSSAAEFSKVGTAYGSIREGVAADLIVLNANPLDNIGNTKKIHSVISNGIYYDRLALDELIEFSEAQTKNVHMNIKLLWDAISSPLKRHELIAPYTEKE